MDDDWMENSTLAPPLPFVVNDEAFRRSRVPLVSTSFLFMLPGMLDASVEELDQAIVEWLETNRPNWFLLEDLIEDGFFERTGIPVPEPVPLPGEARVPDAHTRR